MASRGPVLLVWINLNPSIDKLSHTQKSVDEITYPFPNFNCTVDVWEWISIFPTFYDRYDYLSMLDYS